MDREVLERKPSSVAELVQVVKECWAGISGDVCDKLIKRMPLLCQAVLDAKGGYFDEKLAPQKNSSCIIDSCLSLKFYLILA